MLDDQDGDAQFVPQAADELDHLLGLGGIHACGRLIQQQQVRLAGDRPPDLQPALGAIGQVACQAVPVTRASPQIPGWSAPAQAKHAPRGVTPGMRNGIEQVGFQPAVLPGQDVLQGGHVGVGADVLIGAGNAHACNGVRWQSADRMLP